MNRRDGNAGNQSTTAVGWRTNATAEDLVIESWSEGFMVGALVIMACTTIANIRRKVLLHKLILLEQSLALWQGTFCFMAFPGYGWYLSSTAALLYCSWIIHNVVAWLKVRPFFRESQPVFPVKVSRHASSIYIGTLLCTIPPITFQIYNNFLFFNGRHGLYPRVRPYEALFR